MNEKFSFKTKTYYQKIEGRDGGGAQSKGFAEACRIHGGADDSEDLQRFAGLVVLLSEGFAEVYGIGGGTDDMELGQILNPIYVKFSISTDKTH